jgi:hypothetical protein
MNLNAGEQARDLRNESGKETHAMTPEPVAQVMSPHGVETGVAEEDFGVGASGWVRLENGGDVFADGVEEADHGSSVASCRLPVPSKSRVAAHGRAWS